MSRDSCVDIFVLTRLYIESCAQKLVILGLVHLEETRASSVFVCSVIRFHFCTEQRSVN